MNNAYLLIELGITGHKDLGKDDGVYKDVVYLGPLKHTILTNINVVDSSKNPQQVRYDIVRKKIKKWHKELALRI